MIKAILIDPYARAITEVEHDDSLASIYALLHADCFDCVRINTVGDVIYVDDEGLYRQDQFFAYDRYPNPLAGRGLVLGTGSQGESIDPTITVEDLEDKVRWITSQDALTMARELDRIAAEQQKLYGERVIHIPVADILESQE